MAGKMMDALFCKTAELLQRPVFWFGKFSKCSQAVTLISCFTLPANTSERNRGNGNEAAVMEDECAVQLGRLESDGCAWNLFSKLIFSLPGALSVATSHYDWPLKKSTPIKFYGITSYLFTTWYHVLWVSLARFTGVKTKPYLY